MHVGEPGRNPTIATAMKVQAVLEAAGEPVTRYHIFQELGGSVNYQVIDAVLDYFTGLGLVEDEGPGARVDWTGSADRAPRARVDPLLVERARRLSPAGSLRLAAELTDAAFELSGIGSQGRDRA